MNLRERIFEWFCEILGMVKCPHGTRYDSHEDAMLNCKLYLRQNSNGLFAEHTEGKRNDEPARTD